MLKYLRGISLAVFLAVSLFTGCSFANEDDGFGSARKIESQHFTVYYAPELNQTRLYQGVLIKMTLGV